MMSAQDKAQELVAQFKNILMREDTDCGNEILCTTIAVECAKVAVNEFAQPKITEYWGEVLAELDKI